MKKLLIIIFLMSFSSVGIMAQSENEELTGTIKVRVDGLSCPFCAYGLEKKLKKMEEVTKIEIDVENAFALLTIQEGKTVTDEIIRQKVKDAGFTVREITEVLKDE